MNDRDKVELFILKGASLRIAVESVLPGSTTGKAIAADEPSLSSSIKQFSREVRENAEKMSDYYKLFYMLENDIRKLIDSTLSEAYGAGWWENHSPNSTKEEFKANRQREIEAGVTNRSDDELDYVSFGQLGEIIRANWDLFGGILSNQKALGRVMFSLNMLRGPIAHCGLLAEDEIDRLKLTVKDWFRLLEGPK
jgi:hypothetical protein